MASSVVGRTITLDYPSAGADYGYAFDAYGRVTRIKDGGGTTVAEYGYVGSRVGKRRYPVPDVDGDLSYDEAARLTKITQQKVTGPVDLDSYAYWWDKSSSPTKQQFLTRDGDPSSSYGYDTINRLTYALYFDATNNGTEGFLYDDVGPPRADTYHKNRSGASVSYLADLVNAYTKIDSTARTYDAARNLTDDGSYTYSWDHENRLTKIVRKSDSGAVGVLDYDALSRRVLK